MQKKITPVLAGMVVVVLVSSGRAQPQLMTASSAAYPQLTPGVLAGFVAVQSNGLTVVAGTATAGIKSSGHPGAATDPRAIGFFGNGNTALGTSLQDPVDPNAVFAGGIGIPMGVCLCTGASSDTDVAGSRLPEDRGVGAEGPNNGAFGFNPGEIGVVVLGNPIIDQDFNQHVFFGATPTNSGDPTVLVFKITLQKPGFLRLRWVFGSDEYPHWTTMFNDSLAILVKKEDCGSGRFENLATFKEPGNPNPIPFTLAQLVECGAPIFKPNQLAPNPAVFVGPPASPHAIDNTPGQAPFDYDTTVPYFDHEFGGFTMLLTRETAKPLAIGTYTIKLVIQDVGDDNVDSALFVETDSLKLFHMKRGEQFRDHAKIC